MVFKFLKKYWLFTLLAPLFMIGEVSMDLLQPRLMSTIVDEGVLGLSNNGIGDMNIIIRTGLKMIMFVALGVLSGILSGVFANLSAQNFSNDLRKATFGKIMSFSFEQTDKFSTGSLITRVTNDITQIQNLVMMSIRGFVRTFMLFGGGIFCMLTLDLSFGAVVFSALIPIAAIMIYFMMKVSPVFSVLQKKLDNLNTVMQENVSGARVVKAYVKERHESKRFKSANNELVSSQLKVLVMFSCMMPLMNIILNFSVVAVIVVGGIKVSASSTVTPGNVMAAITYVTQILNAVMRLSMIFQMVSRGNASIKRVNEILITDPVITDGEGFLTENSKGKVEFKNVSFAYPQSDGEENVLSGINFVINPGETVGILGATGSGKTSLINLITRFYDAKEGEVLVNGVNVRDYKIEDLRNKVAVALQKSELFNVSIRENISWGNPNADDGEIEEAATIGQATEFIREKECGFEEIVAQKGMSLSGGQKQRLGISRAVIKNADILIFDDATSALDLKTEAKLYDALYNKCPDVTKIIIAQRVASVKYADRIMIIDNGTIADFDTSENLMKHSEIFRDIYNSQLKAGDDNE